MWYAINFNARLTELPVCIPHKQETKQKTSPRYKIQVSLLQLLNTMSDRQFPAAIVTPSMLGHVPHRSSLGNQCEELLPFYLAASTVVIKEVKQARKISSYTIPNTGIHHLFFLFSFFPLKKKKRGGRGAGISKIKGQNQF